MLERQCCQRSLGVLSERIVRMGRHCVRLLLYAYSDVLVGVWFLRHTACRIVCCLHRVHSDGVIGLLAGKYDILSDNCWALRFLVHRWQLGPLCYSYSNDLQRTVGFGCNSNCRTDYLCYVLCINGRYNGLHMYLSFSLPLIVYWILLYLAIYFELAGFGDETVTTPKMMGLLEGESSVSLKTMCLSCLANMIILASHQFYCMCYNIYKHNSVDASATSGKARWEWTQRRAACFYIRPLITFVDDVNNEITTNFDDENRATLEREIGF